MMGNLRIHQQSENLQQGSPVTVAAVYNTKSKNRSAYCKSMITKRSEENTSVVICRFKFGVKRR